MVALALLSAQLGALAHGLVERHVSARDGAIIDACPQAHPGTGAAEGAAVDRREDAAGHHHQTRHCGSLAFLRSLLPIGPGAGVSLPQRFAARALPPPVAPRSPGGVAVLRLAPKASPPLAA